MSEPSHRGVGSGAGWKQGVMRFTLPSGLRTVKMMYVVSEEDLEFAFVACVKRRRCEAATRDD